MANYATLQDDQYVRIKPGDTIYIACCDCCLVHDWVFDIEYDEKTDKIYIAASCERNERRTAQLRRYGGGELQESNESKWILIRSDE